MYCIYCGKEVEEDWVKCPYCGATLREKADNMKDSNQTNTDDAIINNAQDVMDNRTQNNLKEKNVKRIILYVGGVVAAILVILLIVGVFFNPSKEQEQKQENVDQEEQKEDYSDLNLETLIGSTVEELKEIGFTYNDEMDTYELCSGKISAEIGDGGKVNRITITGIGEEMPSIHGIETGMSMDEAESILKKIYESAGNSEDKAIYLNRSNGFGIGLQAENGNVSQLIVGQLSETDLQEYLHEAYIFPYSDSEYLMEEEVRTFDAEVLRIGRNEIYARHGAIFESEDLQSYFDSMPWYDGIISVADIDSNSEFNEYEKANVELIKSIEDELNGVQDEFIGLEGTYICIDPSDGEFTGRFDITNITDDTLTFTLGTLDGPTEIMTEQAQIIDSYTAQITTYGFTITLNWGDSENMFVTNTGEISGMESAVIFESTNRKSYTRPIEFNP